MTHESALRDLARRAIQDGKLPTRLPDRMWGGPGADEVCAGCALPITRVDLEYEIQFAQQGVQPALQSYHLHLRCFAAWEVERGRAGD